MMYEDYDSEEWDKLLDQMTLKEQAEIILLGSRQLAGVSSVTAPGAKVGDGLRD